MVMKRRAVVAISFQKMAGRGVVLENKCTISGVCASGDMRLEGLELKFPSLSSPDFAQVRRHLCVAFHQGNP